MANHHPGCRRKCFWKLHLRRATTPRAVVIMGVAVATLPLFGNLAGIKGATFRQRCHLLAILALVWNLKKNYPIARSRGYKAIGKILLQRTLHLSHGMTMIEMECGAWVWKRAAICLTICTPSPTFNFR